MIRYALTCEENHSFEAWFASSAAYDEQASRGLVHCPECGSSRVIKAPMAPSIARGGDMQGKRAELTEAIRHMRAHVENTSEYVGDRFASEALKIHHDEAEPRGIYGEATREEATKLRDEGVEFYPLPELPEDHN